MKSSLSLFIPILIAAPLSAQTLPPVRPLGPALARSTEPLGSVTIARALPGGQVLVNDILKRRVLLFDSTLAKVTVVADSTSSTANAYGGRIGGLIPYKGDSTLFVDPASMSMLLIDPSGKIGRVMSAPRSNDAAALVGTTGFPGFDASGKLVYRTNPRVLFSGNEKGGLGSPTFPDSAPILRVDLETRKLDTLVFLKISMPKMSVTQNANGGFTMSTVINPLPITDDWAILNDGTVAVVRGSDYHIDWINADGSRMSSPKTPYDWQRLDDDAKAMVLDSARSAIEKQRQIAMQNGLGGAPAALGGGPTVMMFGGERGPVERGAAEKAAGASAAPSGGAAPAGAAPAGAAPAGAAPAGAAPGAPPPGTPAGGRGAPGAPAPAGGANFQMPAINLVPVNELPDYRPAFTAGSTRGDLDGNLWVRTTSPVGEAGPIYYVINRKGEVIDRVQVPQGRVISGFAPGGIVYLAVRDADGNVRLERAKVR